MRKTHWRHAEPSECGRKQALLGNAQALGSPAQQMGAEVNPKAPVTSLGQQTSCPLNGACWGAVARCIVCKELSAHVVLTSHFLIWDPQESWNSILIKTS